MAALLGLTALAFPLTYATNRPPPNQLLGPYGSLWLPLAAITLVAIGTLTALAAGPYGPGGSSSAFGVLAASLIGVALTPFRFTAIFPTIDPSQAADVQLLQIAGATAAALIAGATGRIMSSMLGRRSERVRVKPLQLPPETPEATPLTPLAPQKPIAPRKFCVHCGNEIAMEARYCTECGKSQPPIPGTTE